MNTSKIKIISLWLIIGPVLALALSPVSWYIINYLSPDKLGDMEILFSYYILGLLMSVMTPWGWLMIGGFLLMNSQKLKIGILCTLAGALLLGGFWPIWATALVAT